MEPVKRNETEPMTSPGSSGSFHPGGSADSAGSSGADPPSVPEGNSSRADGETVASQAVESPKPEDVSSRPPVSESTTTPDDRQREAESASAASDTSGQEAAAETAEQAVPAGTAAQTAPAETAAPEASAKTAAQVRPGVHDSSGRSRDRGQRAPSIPEEADELLNGKRPTARELPRIIAVANQKGGVGKTTTTVNLGAALAERDYRVLVVDLDPQANATTGLGLEARNFEFSMYDVIMRDHPLEDTIEPTSVKNLFVAPATIDLAGIEIELVPAFSREMKLKRAVDSVVDDFDFVLIDCPPSLGLITVNGLAAADEVLVPIQCEYYALEGLSQLLRNVNLVSTNLNETLEVTTIVLTMYDARTRLSVDVANEVRQHFSERVCKVMIPRTVRLSEAPSFGQPITVFDPASRGAVAYRELAKEVSNGAPQRSR
jgi:chromosome partitioning protein